MNTYIAFLRGVNVGGHRMLPMADLRVLLAENEYTEVRTYIQSGNVIFKSGNDAKIIERGLEELIQAKFGFQVDVIVKTPKELQYIIEDYPFSQDNIGTSYFVMFKEQPAQDKVNLIKEIHLPHDHYIIQSDILYLFPEKGYGKSKFNLKSFETKLGVRGTARNYKTMTKLLSLSLN